MGYMRHNCIVITGPKLTPSKFFKSIDEVYFNIKKIAKKYNMQHLVSRIIDSKINDYHSIFIAPDGSKEGWDLSNKGDQMRDEVIMYLDTLKYEDSSTSFPYVELQYYDDNRQTCILRHTD